MKQTFLNLFYVLISLISPVLSTDFKVTKWTQYPNLSRNSMKFVGVSVGQCVDECTRRLSCGSVGYRSWLNLCEVHLEDVTSEDNADDGSYIFIKKDDMLKKKAAANSVKKAGHVCDESTGHCHKECDTFTLEKGKVYGNRRHAGAKVAFSCDDGYREKNGEKSAVCEQSGEWSYYPKCLPAHVGVQATLISAAVTIPETQTNFQETTTPSQGTALFSQGTTTTPTATSPTAALPETTVSSQGTTITTIATSPTAALPGTTVSSQGTTITTTATSPTAALPGTTVSSQGAGSLPGDINHGNVKQLLVHNGGQWGDWGNAVFCPEGSYASGYDMKIQPYQGLFDDTALNGIKLFCKGQAEQTITSDVGGQGDWVDPAFCNDLSGQQFFLTAFDLQVEPAQGLKDDTAANFVKFKCRDLGGEFASPELAQDPGRGRNGLYGIWSEDCPPGTAICGLKTKIEES